MVSKIKMNDLINRSRISVSQMTRDMFRCHDRNPTLFTCMSYHLVRNKSNMMCATHGAGTAYPSGTYEFVVGFVLPIVSLSV